MNMREKNIIIYVLLIILVTISLLLTYFYLSYSESKKDDNLVSNGLTTTEVIEPVKQSLDSLNIMVDPRVELLTTVQALSDYNVLTQLNFTYSEAMKGYFKDYSNHKAVKEFMSLAKSGFSFDAPPTAMLYLNHLPDLEQTKDYTPYLIERAGGESKLHQFNLLLGDFCLETNFIDFFNRNVPFYQGLVSNVSDHLKDLKLTEALDDYYGMKVNSYNLVLSPMLHNGGYGPRVEAENGLYDIYGMIGPGDIIKSANGDIIPEFSTDTISYLIWHEFSHSFVNPTTEKYIDEINQYSNLYTYISEIMKKQAYPNWEYCVNEHIVRAVTARLTLLYDGQTAYENALSAEKGRGFYYIEELCKNLETYESNRDTYPTFESYYPELIQVFKDLSEQDLPESYFKTDFTGPINNSLGYTDTLDLVIILPTNEDNEKTQDEIRSYVRKIKDKFFPDAELIDDVDALERGLTENMIIAYGTMEGNKWLSHYKDIFPYEVDEDGIRADREYEGNTLRLITAIPNPQNYKNPLIIYTAQRPAEVININEVSHGPTDYIIADNVDEICSGFYDKNKDKWTFPKQ